MLVVVIYCADAPLTPSPSPRGRGGILAMPRCSHPLSQGGVGQGEGIDGPHHD